MKLKKSQWCVISQKDRNYRLFHSVLGNVTKISNDVKKILDFFETPKSVSEASNVFNFPKKELSTTIEFLKSNGFLVENQKNDSIKMLIEKNKLDSFDHATLRIYTTEKCNLNCKYCFENKERKVFGKNLDEKICKSGINAFVDFFSKNKVKFKEVKFYLFGGEPLINWELVPKAIRYAQLALSSLSKNYTIGITTNGTLLNKEIAEFLYSENVIVYLSLDGKGKYHDEMRQYASGRGTFKDVERALKLLLAISDENYIKNNISITTTIGYHNINHLPQFLSYLSGFGIKNISFNKIAQCGGLSSGAYRYLSIVDKNFFSKVTKACELGKQLNMNIGGMWGHIRNRLMKGGLVFCSAAGLEFGIGPDGYIYPCPFTFGDKNHRIGQITDNSYIMFNKEYNRWKNRLASNIKECKNCKIIGICRGGCLGMALYGNGNLFSPIGCNYNKLFANYFTWKLPK